MNVREAQASNLLDYSGQKDFYDPVRHGGSVTVVGAGGIGSPTIMGLARMGIPNISVYDDDNVEPHNVVAQNYELEHVGAGKAESITELARKVSVAKIKPYKHLVTNEDTLLGNIVVSAVDSMNSRKAIYEAAKGSPTVQWIVDGRLGGELIVVHTVNIRNSEQVEYYLSDDVMFDDSEVVSNSCTSRAIFDVSYAIAALIMRSVRRILTDEDVERQQMLNMKTLRLDVF